MKDLVMLKLKSWVALALAGACIGGAQAQSVGHYSGTTSQGQWVNLDVSDDGFGNPVMTSFSAGWNPTCADTGMDRTSGWGLPVNAAFLGGTASFEYLASIVKVRAKIKDMGGGVLSGSFAAHTSEFVDGSTWESNRAQRCSLGRTTFMVTLDVEAPRTAPKLQPGQALRIE